MQTASSSSPVPPLAPAAPSTLPSLSLITTAPVCGRNLPCAVAESAPKNCGFSLARCSRVRLATPMPTEAHALPTATSQRNMLAPSSRCSDFT